MDSQETHKNQNIARNSISRNSADRNTGWDTASNTELPNVTSTSAGVWRKAQLQRRFSNTLRENAFMETQIQFLKKKNRLMSDKNIFLQDQFLILKEKYHILQTKNKQAQFTNNSPTLPSSRTTFTKRKPTIPASHTTTYNNITDSDSKQGVSLTKQQNTNNNHITNSTHSMHQQITTKISTNNIAEDNIAEDKTTETKKLSLALFSAGVVINKQRMALQAISKLIQAHKKHNWLFFKKQKKRQNTIQHLNIQLQNYLQQITRKGNVFHQWQKMVIQKQILKHNKKMQKTIKHLSSEKNKVQQKYTQLKAKWEDRISIITQHKKHCFQQAILQHKEQKKQIIAQFNNKITTMEDKQNNDIKSIQHKHQELLSQKELEYKKQLSENEKSYEQLLNKKTAQVARLNNDVANLQKQKMNSEKQGVEKATTQLKKEHELLLKEKTTEWQKIKTRYEETLADIKNNREKEIQNLKNTYNKKINKNQQALDERMIELKEEHDNQLHLLRTEMEHELLAERRKFIKAEKTYNDDINKLQKDFRELQSELELKKFHHKKQEIKENELEGLRVLNTTLQKENKKLKTLWENQRPNMEKQQQQIICLQKLNSELSHTLQNQYIKKEDTIYEQNSENHQQVIDKLSSSASRIQPVPNIQSVFKDIHIHNP